MLKLRQRATWSTRDVTVPLHHETPVRACLARRDRAGPGRAAGTFTSAHEGYWAAASKAHGEGGGTRALVEVLLPHRHHTHADVVAGITAALSVGALSPDVVAVQTRRHAQQQANPTATDPVVVEEPAAPG